MLQCVLFMFLTFIYGEDKNLYIDRINQYKYKTCIRGLKIWYFDF